MAYIREDQALIQVSVDGVKYFDAWASADGADLEAEDGKTRPGGMGREVAVGGPAKRNDLTLEIQLTDSVIVKHAELESKVGNGRVTAGISFLGPNRVPYGVGQTVVGSLKSVTLPSMAADGSDVAMYQMVVSCDEQAN